MGEAEFNELYNAKMAVKNHGEAVHKDVKKTVTKNETYTIVDDSDNTMMIFGKIAQDIFGIKVFDSNGSVVFKATNNEVNLRNVLPYNFDDSLDSSYPLECEFYMPPNVGAINSANVHIVGRNFRAYSKGAASGGGTTSGSGGGQTSSSGTAHKHTISGGTAQDGGAHYHSIGTSPEATGVHDASIAIQNSAVLDVYGNSGSTVAGGTAHIHSSGSYKADAHSHSVTYYGHQHIYTKADVVTESYGNHNHTLSGITSTNESSHTHTVSNHTHTVPNHTHSLTFGIYESTDPTGVNIYVDNGSGYGSSLTSDNSPVNIDYNIASELTTAEGWKKLKITSSRLGRVVVAIILDLTISSL